MATTTKKPPKAKPRRQAGAPKAALAKAATTAKIAGRIALAAIGNTDLEKAIDGLPTSTNHVCWHINGQAWEIFYHDHILWKSPAASPIAASGFREEGRMAIQTGTTNIRGTIKRLLNRTPSQIGISLPTYESDEAEKIATDPEAAAKAARVEKAKAARVEKAKAARVAKAKPAGPKKVSLIDAAYTYLAETGVPAKPKDIVTALAESGAWSTNTGKTPDATLSAAIGREIATRGDAARFTKTGPGTFAAKKGGGA